LNYPEEIEGCVLELAACNEQIRRRRLEIRSLEIDIAAEATTAKGPDGKLLLSNETQRKAAIEKMLVETTEYAEYAETLGNLEQDKVKLEARLERRRLEAKLHILECEQNNAIAAMKVADAIYNARHNDQFPQEVELPF
jgi:hypothetical protein